MKNLYYEFFLMLLVALLPNLLYSQIDLELNLSQNPTEPLQYDFYSVTATLSNTGQDDATGIEVSLPIMSGVVYEGGNEFSAADGNFNTFTQNWTLSNLAAGASTTLTVNYFLLNAEVPVAYAQVTQADQTDADSTPNNGTSPTANEDDEASTQTVVTPIDGCGFVQTYPNQLLIGSSRSIKAEEVANGYHILQSIRDFGSDQDFFSALTTDFSGEEISISLDSMPYPASFQTIVENDDENLNITYIDPNDNEVFSTDVVINPDAGDILDQGSGSLRRVSTGFLYVGTTVVQTSSGVGFFPYIIRLDNDGELLGFDFLPDNDFHGGIAAVVSQANGTGDYVVTVRSGNADLHLIDEAGQVVWKQDLFADTPSSTLYEMEEAAEGGAVLVSTRDNQEGTLRKFAEEDGAIIYEVDYGAVFFPSPSPVFAVFETVQKFIPLPDGGAVFGGRVNTPGSGNNSSYAYARIDDLGNSVWSNQFSSLNSSSLTAEIMTSDSGFLFVGPVDTAGNEILTLIKLNSDGELVPACGGGTGDIDLELAFTTNNSSPDIYTFTSAMLTVTNTSNATATDVVIADYLPNGYVRDGGNPYGTPDLGTIAFGIWSIPTLAAGASASVDVNYFTLTDSESFAFAEVFAISEDDTDSTPGNGDFTNSNEDDEAVVVFNVGNSFTDFGGLGNDDSQKFSSKIFPNPTFNQHLVLETNILTEGNFKADFFDVQGRLIQSQNFQLEAGWQQLPIDLVSFSTGNYYLRWIGEDGQTEVFRVSVME